VWQSHGVPDTQSIVWHQCLACSGLDALSAAIVVGVIRKVADEGGMLMVFVAVAYVLSRPRRSRPGQHVYYITRA
jgi:hypothetical protein